MPRKYLVVLVAGLLLIAALTGWGIVSAVQGAAGRATGYSGELATRVHEILQVTPTIYPGPATVIHQVRSLGRLETVQYTVEKVITAEVGQGALAPLFGDKLLFVAHGQVIAGVDLERLASGDATMDASTGRVTVVLPPAEVLVATLDNEKSYVYDRETGLLTHGDVDLETQARKVAEDEIRKAALEDGILDLAQANAERVLESLLKSLGFTEVFFAVATPLP